MSKKGWAVTCTVWYLVASLASTHEIAIASTSSENQTCLETWPNDPWGAKLPPDRNHQHKIKEGRKEGEEREKVIKLGILKQLINLYKIKLNF